jgi:hypothetical protein
VTAHPEVIRWDVLARSSSEPVYQYMVKGLVYAPGSSHRAHLPLVRLADYVPQWITSGWWTVHNPNNTRFR